MLPGDRASFRLKFRVHCDTIRHWAAADEMIVAISESTVLLQEGNDFEGRGVLGSWVSREATKLDPEAAEEAVRDMKAAREGGY